MFENIPPQTHFLLLYSSMSHYPCTQYFFKREKSVVFLFYFGGTHSKLQLIILSRVLCLSDPAIGRKTTSSFEKERDQQ